MLGLLGLAPLRLYPTRTTPSLARCPDMNDALYLHCCSPSLTVVILIRYVLPLHLCPESASHALTWDSCPESVPNA